MGQIATTETSRDELSREKSFKGNFFFFLFSSKLQIPKCTSSVSRGTANQIAGNLGIPMVCIGYDYVTIRHEQTFSVHFAPSERSLINSALTSICYLNAKEWNLSRVIKMFPNAALWVGYISENVNQDYENSSFDEIHNHVRLGLPLYRWSIRELFIIEPCVSCTPCLMIFT